MDLDSYQEQAARTDETQNLDLALNGLIGEVGSVFSVIKKGVRDRAAKEELHNNLKEELGDCLWYLSVIANHYGIKMSEIAVQNIKKTRSIFDEGDIQFFDSQFPDQERLPRQAIISFVEEDGKVRMSLNGKVMGDPISDNSHTEDLYRYHDVFHLAYWAVLGWSPVIRAIMKRKRKSNSIIDEVEDGARACIIEESVSAMIFGLADANQQFRDMHNISFSLFKTISIVVRGLEVSSKTYKQWQKAIVLGFRVYRQLVENRGGRVRIDMDAGRIEYIGPCETSDVR